MIRIPVDNAFGAPVWAVGTTVSTMDDARALALEGAPSGTVVKADSQSAGRGRVAGRTWHSEPGESLLCTVLVRYPAIGAIPQALTLRCGLAAAEAIEDCAPELSGRVRVKWPNDLLIESESAALKVCGILCESDGANVFIGTGCNLLQTDFPDGLARKATSIFKESGTRVTPDRLLTAYLSRLERALSTDYDDRWRGALLDRLYKRALRVSFEPGLADSGILVEGTLAGVGEDGRLLLKLDGSDELRGFISGELRVYDA